MRRNEKSETQNRLRVTHPFGKLRGYVVRDSSNVQFVGWQEGDLYVWFKQGGFYRYVGVSRQRCVAAALAPSVGSYIARKIKPNYPVVRIA